MVRAGLRAAHRDARAAHGRGYCRPRIETVDHLTKALGGPGKLTVEAFDGSVDCETVGSVTPGEPSVAWVHAVPLGGHGCGLATAGACPRGPRGREREQAVDRSATPVAQDWAEESADSVLSREHFRHRRPAMSRPDEF